MSDTRENLLKRVFKDYCRFFYYENQLALFEGRNFEVIYTFYDTLSTLRSQDTTLKDWMEKVNTLTKIVNNFISCSNSIYPFLLQDENCCDLGNISYCNISTQFNDSVSDYFDRFYITYSLVMRYKEAFIIEELLIEFNNYMSHFVKYIVDDSISSGVSHLYRACLDGYKDIILENNIALLSDTILRDGFIKLRVDECSKIGIKEDKKLSILEEYHQISTDILTLYNCDE